MRAGHTVLAVIPARGGSKGVPRKNLRTVGGTSLVGRAAALASGTDWIDMTVVSTEDDAIRAEAEAHGASAPFRRPADLAGDAAGARETWRHAWRAAEDAAGRQFGISLYLEPTSPLRRRADLEATVDALIAADADVAATVSANAPQFTPEKTLVVGADGRLGHYLSDGARFATRQRIARRYHHRNGICYAAWRRAIVERDGNAVLEGDCVAVEIERPVVNIDDPFDLELAEWLLARAADTGPVATGSNGT